MANIFMVSCEAFDMALLFYRNFTFSAATNGLMGEEVERILDRVKTIAGRDNHLPLLINHLLTLLDGFKTRCF
jgi:hypothetical protein